MSVRKKLETLAGIVPAIVIAVCVCMALSGYTQPVYEIDETAAAHETPELKELSLDIPVQKKAAKLEKVKESAAYRDGVYYGSAMGFNGQIKVKVTIKDGKISDIEIVNHTDDQPYLNNAKNSILPAIIKKQTTNVDTVSGATFSSNGIIKAVRNALTKAAVTGSSNKTSDKTTDNDNSEITEIPDSSGEGNIETPENFVYKDGEYTNDSNMVLCEHPADASWAYYLSVKVIIKDGKIAAVEESKKIGKTGTYNTQNDSYLKRAFKGLGSRKGMEAKIIELQGTAGVDTVTGATISSNSILQSVNRILAMIEKIPVEADDSSDASSGDASQIEDERTETGEETDNDEISD